MGKYIGFASLPAWRAGKNVYLSPILYFSRKYWTTDILVVLSSGVNLRKTNLIKINNANN